MFIVKLAVRYLVRISLMVVLLLTNASYSPTAANQLANAQRLVPAAEQPLITAFAWSEDALMLVIALSQEMRIYRVGQAIPTIITAPNAVSVLAIRQDNQVLASTDATGVVKLWDITTGETLASWGSERVGFSYELYFIPQTEILAINFFDWQESNIRPGTGVHFWDYSNPDNSSLVSTSGGIGENNMKVSAENTYLFTTIGATQQRTGRHVTIIMARNIATGENINHISWVGSYVAQVVSHPVNPNIIATLDAKRIVRVWDIIEAKELFTLPLPRYLVTVLAFGNDGSVLITGGIDGKTRIWNVEDGDLLEIFGNYPRKAVQIRMTPSRHILSLAITDDNAEIWHNRTDKIISSWPLHAVDRQ